MAQWMRVLVSKPGNSSSMPRCHIVEREKGLSQAVLETPVLIISPAEALNGQCRQKKAVQKDLVASVAGSPGLILNCLWKEVIVVCLLLNFSNVLVQV